MLEPSSMPAGAFFLDGEATIERLRDLADSLLRSRTDILAVYLFGSLAQGRHVPGSDADLLIILSRDERRMVDRIPEFLRVFLDSPVPVDVLPLTEQELAVRQGEGDLFTCQALDEGMLVTGHLRDNRARQTRAAPVG